MPKTPEEQIDWDTGEDVVVRTQRAIRVYLNPHDDVVIAQEPGPLDNDDDFPFVVVRKENVPAVIAALTRVAGLGPRGA